MSDTALVLTDEQKALEAEVMSLPDQARAFVITDEISYVAADTFFNAAHRRIKQIDKLFDDSIETAKASLAAAKALKAIPMAPVVEAKAIVKNTMNEYNNEKARIQLIAQRAAEAAARKAAEEAQRAQIAAAKAAGDKAEAKRIKAEPVHVPEVKLAPVGSVCAQSNVKMTWGWAPEDEALIPREYMMLDRKKIDAIVKEKGEGHGIPGISVFPDTRIAASRL